MRSRLIVRHKRRCIYLSNLIVCIAAGFTLCAAYLLPHTALSMLLPGEYEAAATVLAYTALYVLIAMLCQNKAYTTAGCLLLVFALLFAGIRIVSVLNEPAYYSGYSYMENGVTVAEGRSETPIIFAARSGSFTNFCTFPAGRSGDSAVRHAGGEAGDARRVRWNHSADGDRAMRALAAQGFEVRGAPCCSAAK